MRQLKKWTLAVAIIFVAVFLTGCQASKEEDPFKTPGSIVTFGRYPQTEKGKDNTPIEWIVLEYDEVNHRALLLSKYGLDVQPYNTEKTDITWETCSLRTWLNQDFVHKAFTKEERSAILLTDVDNSDAQGNSEWSTTGGNNTQDYLFPLSCAEANRYLNVTSEDTNNMISRVTPTAYAIKQGAFTSDSIMTAEGGVTGQWWLRSPGYYQYRAACVFHSGPLNNVEANNSECIRPAFWINLNAIGGDTAEGTTESTVTFGCYPQTKAGTDETPIEWIVLEVDEANHRELLLSKYGLDAKPYNTKVTDYTWETCSLRTWLNNDFLNRAFSAEEQSAILLTEVDNSNAQGYSGWYSGGNNTQDRVFLLSCAEVKRYFNVEHYSVSWSDRNTASRVAPTAYAIQQGAWRSDSDNKTTDGNDTGWWWLRSPGGKKSSAAYVNGSGSLYYNSVNHDGGCVRPALWIDMDYLLPDIE